MRRVDLEGRGIVPPSSRAVKICRTLIFIARECGGTAGDNLDADDRVLDAVEGLHTRAKSNIGHYREELSGNGSFGLSSHLIVYR
jgi:hypothetical protein